MHPTDLSNLPPGKLAHLLDLESLPQWSSIPDDAAAILRHQLAAPLLPDLASAPGSEPARLEALLKNRPCTQNFLAQLTAITPSLELLQAIKDFARHANNSPAHPLSGGGGRGGTPATLLYYAAIAAALLRCNTRITQLPDPSLREAFTWAAAQQTPEELHSLFTTTLTELKSSSSS